MTHILQLPNGLAARVDRDTFLTCVGRDRYVNKDGYVVVICRDGLRYLHRLAMHEIPAGQEVDHISGDRLDNRRANLRLVTRQQNLFNRGPTGRYKGITHTGDRWKARIQKDGKCYSLGCYDDPEAAALAYDLAAAQLFGDFARLNCVDHPDRQTIAQLVAARLSPRQIRIIPKRKSPYRGVYWERGRWRAKIGVRDRALHLGYFDDEIEAARAYDRAAVRWHGERAQLNFGSAGR